MTQVFGIAVLFIGVD